jgi:hypothetical protein
MPTTAHIRNYIFSDHVKSNIVFYQPQCQPVPHSDFTNCNANHCPYSKLHIFGPCKIEYSVLPTPVPTCGPFPILPTAMPTTAHIRNYMIFYHVKSNIEFYQPQCQPVPHSDFTNCNANHCPYSKLHIFGPCKIEYRVLPTPVPTCAPFPILPTAMPTTAHIRNYMIFYHVKSNIEFYQPQCQPVPHSDYTNCNANHCPYSKLHDFGPCII